jgi:Glycosyl transferase family 21
VVSLNEDDIKAHDKKLALTLGIKGARYEHLLFTDADCVPSNNKWIAGMARNFANDKEIVIGYGPYKKTGGLLNMLIRFDTYMIGLQYLSAALAGKTYMGIGRNMAYTKSLFFRHKGFASQYHIQSGDDDLFINKVAEPHNVSVEIHPDSFTYSDPKITYKAWINQKRRHLTTAKHYRAGSKILLSGAVVSQYLFFIGLIVLMVLGGKRMEAGIIIGIKYLIQLIIWRKSMLKMNEKDLWLAAPLLEILLLMLYPFIYIGNYYIKQHKWK